MKEINHIFVYGLLMTDIIHPIRKVISQYCESRGEAFIEGELYEIDGYPGLLIKEGYKIRGEVLRIRHGQEDLLKILDDFEGVLGGLEDEYLRSIVDVRLKDITVCSWVYVYNRPVTTYKKIESGDFRTTIK